MSKGFSIGGEFFDELRKNDSYYVDKTEILYDLLSDSRIKVALFTRPRRFGKTLMMSMMENFLNINKDSKEIFEGLNIMKHPETCEKHMNKYPVIFISFKGVEGLNFESAYESFKGVIAKFCDSITEIVDNEKLNEKNIYDFNSLLMGTATLTQLKQSLSILMTILYRVYGRKVVVLIDEYDVPVAKAYAKGGKEYYDNMLDLIRGVLDNALKTNPYLEFAVVTGCLRIVRESIFTGVNHFKPFSIMDIDFSTYFGFTEDEVQKILTDIGCKDKLPLVREWYDGYVFGKDHMYCPWDVMNYAYELKRRDYAKPKNYWQNTSSNDVVSYFVKKATQSTKSELENLVNGGTVVKPLVDNINYDIVNSDIDNLYTMLYTTGYLTKASISDDTENVELKLTNKEVESLFQSQVMTYFKDSLTSELPTKFVLSLWDGNTEEASDILTMLLEQTVSYHDYCESYYHAFLAGFLAKIDNYEVMSNKETGKGRADIIIKDFDNRRAMVIEAKFTKDEDQIDKLCDEAVKQIATREYGSDINKRFYQEILSFGIVFFEKNAFVKMKID